MSDKMREAFETWALRNRYPLEKHMKDRYWYNDTNRVWKAWQAACESQQQAGEPVGWLEVEHWRGMPNYQNVDYEHADVTLPPGRHALYTAPKPQPDWVPCSERLPTDEDENEDEEIWVAKWLDDIEEWEVNNLDRHNFIESLNMPWQKLERYYWKPTGLTRPEPPEDV